MWGCFPSLGPAGFLQEIAFGRDLKQLVEKGSLGVAEHGGDLLRIPQVKGPLLALAVGVLGAVESAFGGGQIAQDIRDDLARRLGVELVAPGLIGISQRHDEECLIVEHFFEMGHQPDPVGGVTVQAEPNLVVNPTQAHRGQRAIDHIQGGGVPVR